MDAPPLNDETNLRPLMFSIAYRMTGSVAEAEDLVQEAFFRMGRARQSGVEVESPKAYLTATTTRLAINHLRSARVRRESYVGTWLPEPVVADLHDNPEQMTELSDSLSMAFLLLLESLSPVERAVFLLREVFDYPYEDIAQIVDKSETNCRQISCAPAIASVGTKPATRHRTSKARLWCGRSWPRPGRVTSANLSTSWPLMLLSMVMGAARPPVRPNPSWDGTWSLPSSSVCSNGPARPG
jgi:RNA polymerase sigma factor (sigma-70 family)